MRVRGGGEIGKRGALKPRCLRACGFESHPPHLRSRDEVRLALFLAEEGFNQSQIERLTGIPRRTVGDWVRLGPPGSRPGRRQTRRIDPADVPSRPYAYLLGLYL